MARKPKTIRQRCEELLSKLAVPKNRTDVLLAFVLAEMEKVEKRRKKERPKADGTLRRRTTAYLDRVLARHSDHATEKDTDSLVEFVLSEIGRSGDLKGDDSLPLVIYFKEAKDRQAFIELVRLANPKMIARPV